MYTLLVVLTVLLTPETGTATWYGNEFVGRHHAAYWHNKTPAGAPPVVDLKYLGCAAPIDVPFGTRLTFTRIKACHGYESPFDGRSVTCTVVDRMAQYTIPGYYDLWPATAWALGFGPDHSPDDGCVAVRVQQVQQRESILGARLRRIEKRYSNHLCEECRR